MKSKNVLKTVLSLSLMASVMTSCSSDDNNPDAVDEEEVITTIKVALSSEGGDTHFNLKI